MAVRDINAAHIARDPEGRKVIPMQESVRRPSAPLGERGRTGTQAFHGFIATDEYVPELTGLSGLRTFDKMRRSDGMVKAVLRGLMMPLLSAEWEIVPADDDEKNTEIGEEIEDGLFEGLTTSWQDTLRQILSFLPFGFGVFETVFEVRDVDGEQKFMLRKLAPRLQKTILKFNTADDGGLETVTQSTYGSRGFENIDIDIGRLLVFVNEKEGADWMGLSVLRPAYKHWWIKDTLYRIQAMAAERWGVGIPSVTLPPDQSDDDNVRKAENILASLRAHERGYVVWPAGYLFSLITSSQGGGQQMDLLPMIQHHDRMIAVAMLEQFLTLGSNDVGSWALSADQSGLFLMVEQSIGDYVCDIINRHLIPRWVDYNYAGVKEYPKLKVTKIETRKAVELLSGLANAANAGLITPDDDIEDDLREMNGLPLLPRDANGDVIRPEMPAGMMPPGVQDTMPQLGGATTPPGQPPSGAATNPSATKGQPMSPAPPGARLNRRRTRRYAVRSELDAELDGRPAAHEVPDPATETGPLVPLLTVASDYASENAQIARNAAMDEAKAPHAFHSARFTTANGHPRCLMCGLEPMNEDAQGDLHTSYPKEAMPFVWSPKRALTKPESYVDFEALDRTLAEAKGKIKDGAETPVQRIIRDLAARAVRALKAGDPSILQADALGLDTGELEAALKTQLDDLYRTGALHVRDEIKKQIVDVRGTQAAQMTREAALIETYRHAFEEITRASADAKTGDRVLELVKAMASRPIVVQTEGGKKRVAYKTKIDEHGVVTGIEPVEE